MGVIGRRRRLARLQVSVKLKGCYIYNFAANYHLRTSYVHKWIMRMMVLSSATSLPTTRFYCIKITNPFGRWFLFFSDLYVSIVFPNNSVFIFIPTFHYTSSLPNNSDCQVEYFEKVFQVSCFKIEGDHYWSTNIRMCVVFCISVTNFTSVHALFIILLKSSWQFTVVKRLDHSFWTKSCSFWQKNSKDSEKKESTLGESIALFKNIQLFIYLTIPFF